MSKLKWYDVLIGFIIATIVLVGGVWAIAWGAWLVLNILPWPKLS